MKNKQTIRARLLVGGIAAALVLPVQAYAQDQDVAPSASSHSSVGIGDIVVTARRRAESQQSVPIAITAISEQSLSNLQVNDAGDLTALEPSLSVSASSGYANRPVYSIRGIRPAEAIYGQDPTVAIYMADVVQSPSQGSNLGFYDLENVQILKGPQGTLFGRNTVGGAILLTPRKPGRDFGGYFQVNAGNFGRVELEAAIDIPLAERFQVRVAGHTVDTKGYQTNVAPGPLYGTKLGGETTRSFRVTAVGQLTDTIENTTIVAYDERNTNGRGTVLQAVNLGNSRIARVPGIVQALQRAQDRDINDIESDVRSFDNVSAWSVTNTTAAQLNDELTLKSILSYREVKAAVTGDLDATAFDITNLNGQYSNLQHHSAELQLQGDSFEGRLKWVAGAYYYHEEGMEFSPGTFFGERDSAGTTIGLPGLIEQGAAVKNDSYSLFAQASYELTDGLTLTAGGRMNWDKRRMTLLTKVSGICGLMITDPANPNGTIRPPADQCAVPLSKNFTQPTGTASLDYKIAPGVLVYATSRLGYRSGGFNLRADIPAEYVPFKPEKVVDAEIGTKADWRMGDVRMRTNVAVYNQWYDNIQRTVAVENFGGAPGSSVINAAKAKVFGIELQQTIQPADGLSLSVGYSYIKPKYDDWQDAGVDVSDTPFFFTPTHSGNATLNYERPLAGDGGTLHFTGNAAYAGKQWINALHTSAVIAQHPADVIPLLQQEAYWLVNLSAGWRNIQGSGVDVLGWIKNVTNEEYKTGGVQLYTGALGFISASYGEPRTYGLQVRYSF